MLDLEFPSERWLTGAQDCGTFPRGVSWEAVCRSAWRALDELGYSAEEEAWNLAWPAEPAEGVARAVFSDAGCRVLIRSVAGRCRRRRDILSEGFHRKLQEHSKV